jgi:hypothetical protein
MIVSIAAAVKNYNKPFLKTSVLETAFTRLAERLDSSANHGNDDRGG